MDIALLPNGQYFIIELNPFSSGTGAPFYSWKPNSEGLNQLLNGPYELRVRQEPLENPKEEWLVPAWEHFIQEVRK